MPGHLDRAAGVLQRVVEEVGEDPLHAPFVRQDAGAGHVLVGVRALASLYMVQALDLIPESFVNERLSGMRCDGDRCSALSGKVGEATACLIYAMRPDVCRTCMPGDVECAMARKRHGLPVLG